MKIWHFISTNLKSGTPVMLLCVVESTGSSPGRQGFMMAVANDGSMVGTIGGGIMEHKLVEKAKADLARGIRMASLLPQYHNKSSGKDQSGMICSGSQTIAMLPFYIGSFEIVEQIIEKKNSGSFEISSSGLQVFSEKKVVNFYYYDEQNWKFVSPINSQPLVHIIGAGHVGLALSELMKFIGFYVKLYDDRPDLNTLAQNSFADETIIVKYSSIKSQIQVFETDYVVIMSFGYRMDKVILEQLLNVKCNYLGLMGSAAKIRTLFEELEKEGWDSKAWRHIHSPIGLSISSKTAREIAVSIAGEIISVKNRKEL